MRAVTADLVLIFALVMDLSADKKFLATASFMDDYAPSTDLSFASTDSSFSNGDDLFENGNAPDLSLDLSPDLSFGSADLSALDYFQPDEASGYGDSGLSIFSADPTLSADAENPNCNSDESQLPARLRARSGACGATSSPIDPPTLFDLTDPRLKLQPICPMEAFPFYTIAVCSSGNPLDEWGPITALLLYDSEQGESIYAPSFLRAPNIQDEVLKSLVITPADLLACVFPRKLYCCRRYIPVTDSAVQRSDDTRHGRPVCYS